MPLIRFTEVDRSDQIVQLEIEGYLTQSTLDDIRRVLTDYAHEEMRQVCVLMDQLTISNDLVLRQLCQLQSKDTKLIFNTTRLSLYSRMLHWTANIELGGY
ncbi:MAG: hypothetical protein GKR89_02850 [Candidatus Latescibacteria bacterium]|nr:hypothetical protein [Candidatus Latescibacterota bacterium]